MAGTTMTIRVKKNAEAFALLAAMKDPRKASLTSVNELVETFRGRRRWGGANPNRNFISGHFDASTQTRYMYARIKKPYAWTREPFPILVQSGNLKRKVLNFKKTVGLPTSRLTVTSPVYAAIHHYGGTITRGWVRPKTKKALRWIDKRGRWVFAKNAISCAIRIPKRDYFRVDRRDEVQASVAIGEALVAVVTGKVPAYYSGR